MVFHVINRGNRRDRIFWKHSDFKSFERIIIEVMEHVDTRLLSYCLMPNHWYMVVWPLKDGDLGRFVHRVTTTHVRRSHLHTDRVGTGHLYQGIYKSFPIQNDHHLYTVMRYVERNPLRAGLVEQAEEWEWSSFWAQTKNSRRRDKPSLSDWPIERPSDWPTVVNTPLTMTELSHVRVSINRGRPYGNQNWQQNTAQQLRLTSTLHPRGRPSEKRG